MGIPTQPVAAMLDTETCATPQVASWPQFAQQKQAGGSLLHATRFAIVTDVVLQCGLVSPAAELAEVCHSEGVPLLVDEAHGGHFTPMGVDVAGQDAPAHTAASATPPRLAVGDAGVTNHQEGQQQQQQNLPVSALDAGADLVMHSSHKVLTAMTQAAMLHLQRGSQVQPSRISKALQVRQPRTHSVQCTLTQSAIPCSSPPTVEEHRRRG